MLVTKLKTLGQWTAAVAVAVGLLVGTASGTAAPRPEPKAARAPVPDAVTSDDEVKKLYAQLGESDADRVLEAAAALMSTPKEAVAFLKKVARPVSLDDKTLDELIADLGSETETKREAATKQLEETSTHPKVSRRLFAAMRATDDQETRQRLARVAFSSWGPKANEITAGVEVKFSARKNPGEQDSVLWTHGNGAIRPKLQAIDIPIQPQFVVGPDKSLRQLSRAVLVLERISTPDAVAVLKELATGDKEVKATAEAKAALKRLEK